MATRGRRLGVSPLAWCRLCGQYARSRDLAALTMKDVERHVTHSSPDVGAAGLLVLTAALWSFGGVLIKWVDWNPLAISGTRSILALPVLALSLRGASGSIIPSCPLDIS